MIKLLKKYQFFFVSIAAGALLSLGFAPYNQIWAAFLSPLLLLAATEGQKPKDAAYKGFLFGLGLFGFGVYWVFHSIFHFGQTTTILAYIITGSFVAILALFPALMMYFTNKWFKDMPLLRATIGLPIIWVLFEIFRGHLLTGFPWLYIGTTQTGNAALRAFAPIGSVWMVSWALMVSSGAIYGFMLYFSQQRQNKKQLYRLGALFVSIWVIGAMINQHKWVKPDPLEVSVALIQGNVPQQMRWDPKQVVDIMTLYEEMTSNALDSSIIIWPEGAIPMPLPYSDSYFQRINRLIVENKTALIAGVPVKAENQEAYYNALIGLGQAKGIYYKEQLVPFGEFVPFEKLLRGLIGFFDLPMSSFIAKDNPDTTITAYGLNFAPAICYEIAFPRTVQKNVKNADFIITVSNDTWFGRTIGPDQHLQLAQWRAIETGRYVLRATNTGLTAIISPTGRAEVANQFETTILRGVVSPMNGQTPWVKFGIWPLLLAMLAVLGAPFANTLPGLVKKHAQPFKKKVKKWQKKRKSK
tara:strand:- start:8784 stop:10361 length:1578 start_codon:yes stop_codon:yes gene_type:complete